MIQELKAKGIQFSEGLTESEILKIEDIYEIKFPKSLREFYGDGVPFSDIEYAFPRWTDYSEANITGIKSYWIQGPIDRLLPHVTMNDYWIPEWGKRPESPEDIVRVFTKTAQKAPKLIPIHHNAYMPILTGVDDPPVISAVEFDVVYGLHNLHDFLESHFLEDDYNRARKERLAKKDRVYIPFWSDIFNYNIKTAAENFNAAIRKRSVQGEDFKTAEDFI
jgi:hypothetical protein